MLYFACCFSVLYTLQRCCGKMKVRETNQNKYSCYLLIRMDSNQTHTVPPEK